MNTNRNLSTRERERERERESPFHFQALYRAYLDCRRHKRHTYHAAQFELNFEKELLKLEEELQSHTYEPGRSICFVITEPATREIFATSFRDRVVQHLLYDYLEPIFEPKFIHGSYACRKEKGLHRSLKDLQKYLRAVSGNHTRETYFLHLDIRAFFMSVRKDILFRLIEKHVRHPEILWLAHTIIFNEPTENYFKKGDGTLFDTIPPHKSLFGVPRGQGLPIGNLTSQFFGNVYLDELDQFVKHTLKAKYYLRYVDDFLLLSNNKKELKMWGGEIDAFLKERLRLKLHPDKQILGNADEGMDWLGYIVKPRYILVRRRIVKRFRNKLFWFNRMLENKLEPGSRGVEGSLQNTERLPSTPLSLDHVNDILATVNSYYGHFGHADTFQLRKHLWEKHFGKLKKYLEPKNERIECFRIRDEFRARATRASEK